MRVRIRLGQGPLFQRRDGKNRHIAGATAALLTPAAVVAAVIAVWRIGSDIGLTGQFAFTDGVFSHWQIWIAIAAILQFAASLLNRYASQREHASIHKTLASTHEVRTRKPPVRMLM
jgi:DMSO/TMAO reductase YedYZ heme-binding membrane subunit